MTRDGAPTWYLFDYGLVVSTAPEPADWARLEQVTGHHLEAPTSLYWLHREQFDAGALTAEQYWGAVVGRPVDDEQVAALEALDLAQWSHLDQDTLRLLESLRRGGAGLALLSNMPAGLAERLRDVPWLGCFSRLFFSGLLGLAKPDPRVYRHVLAELDARPEQVVFVDDRQVNVDAARAIGMRAVLKAPGTDLHDALLGPTR